MYVSRHEVLFFFNDTATTEIYPLSLHDALPISRRLPPRHARGPAGSPLGCGTDRKHTSELQSQSNLVCRLLLEKKKSRYYMRSGRMSALILLIQTTLYPES